MPPDSVPRHRESGRSLKRFLTFNFQETIDDNVPPNSRDFVHGKFVFRRMWATTEVHDKWRCRTNEHQSDLFKLSALLMRGRWIRGDGRHRSERPTSRHPNRC